MRSTLRRRVRSGSSGATSAQGVAARRARRAPAAPQTPCWASSDVSAPMLASSRSSTGRGRAVGAGEQAAEERLAARRRPAAGSPSAGRSGRGRAAAPSCARRVLAKPEPGVEHDPVAADAGGQHRLDPLGQLVAHVGDHAARVVVRRVLLHAVAVGAPVHRDVRRARLRRPRRASRGSARPPETSLTIAAPASTRGRGDLGAHRVDRDRRRRRRPGRAMTGTHPVELLVDQRAGSAPGRVDSPPTSRMSAPVGEQRRGRARSRRRGRPSGRRRRTSRA